jgi:beta-glucanase (GH16 family)
MNTPAPLTWLRTAGLPRRIAIAACAGLLATAAAPALTADATVGSTTVSQAFTQAFSDDFTGTAIDKTKWAVYNNPTASLAHSAKNVVVQNGVLTLKTAYDSTLGKYTTAGVCLCPQTGSLAQTYGEWEVRARVSAGDSRALMMLWPEVGWPPEIDFLEMGAQGAQGTRQQSTQTMHYDTDNKMIHSNQFADFTQWHTVGVQWGPGFLQYMLDGQPTYTIVSPQVPTQRMRLGLVTSPNLAGPTTQAVNYDIDWVKQYAYTGGAGTAPAAPSGVVATPGDTNATVSWTPPANTGNSMLTGYTVTAQPGGQTMTVARSGVNDPKTSAVFPGLTPGVSYTFSVAANNPFGTSAASAASAPVTVTGTPPSVTAPTAAFVKNSTFGSGATSTDAPVRVSWATTAGSAPVCQQSVVRQAVSGQASPLKVSATATTLNDRLPAAGTAGYAVNAIGCNGLSSGAVAGPSYNYKATQQDAAGVTTSGTWSTVSCSACSGGTMRETKEKGASITFPLTNAYAAALVVRTGPQQSPVNVYVDGTYVGQFRAGATADTYRTVAFTTNWATAGNHTLTFANAAASTRPLFDVDALLSLTK